MGSAAGNPHGESAFQRFVFARLPGRTTPGFLTGTFTFKRADQQVFSGQDDFASLYVPIAEATVFFAVAMRVRQV